MARVSSNELKPEAISPSLQYIEDLLYICVPGMSDEELTEFENYKDNMISTYVKIN